MIYSLKIFNFSQKYEKLTKKSEWNGIDDIILIHLKSYMREERTYIFMILMNSELNDYFS